ncbi:MAG: hypothetical protein WC045_00140 [Patescibacteria group bacterium]
MEPRSKFVTSINDAGDLVIQEESDVFNAKDLIQSAIDHFKLTAAKELDFLFLSVLNRKYITATTRLEIFQRNIPRTTVETIITAEGDYKPRVWVECMEISVPRLTELIETHINKYDHGKTCLITLNQGLFLLEEYPVTTIQTP